MVSIEKEAKNVEAAIALGLEQLDVERDEVDIEVLKEGGLFSKARVRLTLKKTKKDELCEYIQGILDRMGIDCTVDIIENESGFVADISGKDSAIAIGHRGEVLDALQYLATIFLNKQDKNYTRLSLDVEGYRERRKATLIALAKRLADKADRMGTPVDLEPMTTVDRRTIHEALSGDERVTTESKGDDPNRYVSIIPVGKTPTYGTSKAFKTSGTKTRSFGAKKRRF